MKKILIATHGYMADGVKSSVKILTGKESCITCINAYVDESDYTEQIQQFIDGVQPGDDAIIFTDLYGGSVNQRVVQLLPRDTEKNLYLITSFNLAAVLGAVLSDEPFTPESIREIVEGSARQMGKMPKPKKQLAVPKTDDEFFG